MHVTMMKQILLLPALIALCSTLQLQAQILFEKRFGINNDNFDYAAASAPAPGGDLVICGYTELDNQHDLFIQKLDTGGAEIWYRRYTQLGTGVASGILPAAGGGYLVSGYVLNPADGSFDALLFKVDDTGNLLWSKTFGTVATEAGLTLCQLAGGNILLLGATIASDNQPAFFRAVFDTGGNLLSSKYIPVADDVTAIKAIATKDGGCLILISAGIFTVATDLIKYDAALHQEWSASLSTYKGAGGSSIESIYDVKPTTSGFLLCVNTATGIDLLHISLNNTPIWAKHLRTDFAYGAGIQPYGDGTIGVASYGNPFIYKTLADSGVTLDSAATTSLLLLTNYDASYVFNANRAVYLIGNGYAGDTRVYHTDYVSISGTPANVWNQTFGTAMPEEDETGDAIVATPDNGFVLAGTRLDSTGKKALWVLKADAQGAVLWEKTIAIGSGIFAKAQPPGSIKLDANGNIAVFAASGYSAPEYHLILLSPAGNLIFDKVIATTDYYDTDQLRAYPIPGGGFIACLSYYSTQLTPRLIRTDAGGNVLWDKDYTGSLVNDLAVISANSFIGAGDKSDAPWIFKVDGNGNLVWEKTYPVAPMEYGGLNAITITADGNLAAVGVAGDDAETMLVPNILKASSVDGTLLWQKQLSKGNNSFWLGTSVLPTPSNGICFTGIYLEPPANADYLSSIFRERISVTTLSATGAVLSDQGFGNDATRPDGMQADGTPDGKVILCATIYSGTSLQDAWVAKVDGKTVSMANANLERSFTVFPNPARGRTLLSLSNDYNGPVLITILDAGGREMTRLRSEKRTATWQSDLALGGLLPGTYWVQLRTGTGTAAKTLIIAP